MGSLSNYGERLALNAASGYAGSEAREIALFTDSLNSDGVGTEADVTKNYSRKTVTFYPALTTLSGVTSTSNNSLIEFGPASEDWDDIVSIGIYNDAGDLIWYADLDSGPISVKENDKLQFAIGSISIEMD